MRFVIATRIYRPEPSAASLMLGSVADTLTSRGHKVEVLTVSPPRHLPVGDTKERVRMFPVLRDKSGYVRGYLQYMSFDIPLFFRLLFTRRPDAVFVEPPPTTGAAVRIVCTLRRIPYVYDAADIWSDAAGHATSSGLVVKVVRELEKFALRGARKLVTISQGVVDRVRELGVNTEATVTGYGADTDTFHYVAAQSIDPVFIYAGTHTELHGAGVLVEAFADFTKTNPGYRLQFIGNGTGQDEMRARASELGINASVSFEPTISTDELRTRLACATASLATLLPGGGYEYAFTTKVYSSLATGCPVIFAGPGPTGPFMQRAAAEVRAGFAVEYGAAKIADAMRAIVAQPAGPNARRSIAEWTFAEHSMRAVSERVSDVIESVATRGSAHG